MTMSYEALLETLRSRRSVRRFRDAPVPDGLLEQVLEAARWAPSAGNRQAFRFLVLRSRRLRDRLLGAVRDATTRLRAEARPGLEVELGAYLDGFGRFAAAPVVIAPIYRSAAPDLLRADQEGALPRAVADGLAGVSAAILSLLLAAHALGLGACWMTGPLVAAPALEALLEVPRGWALAALVPLGFPDEEPAPPPRRPLEQLVRNVEDPEEGSR
jgi:nitroreductase